MKSGFAGARQADFIQYQQISFFAMGLFKEPPIRVALFYTRLRC